MNTYLLHPLARFLVAFIFIMSGVGKLAGFAATEAMMGAVGFPAPGLFLVSAIALELIGGVALLLGFKTRWAAAALVVFLIPATLIFHAANIIDPQHGQEQFIHMLKNLAILGALVKIAADGAGAYALDNLSARAASHGAPARTVEV